MCGGKRQWTVRSIPRIVGRLDMPEVLQDGIRDCVLEGGSWNGGEWGNVRSVSRLYGRLNRG